jgi:alkanesulfonate monooxygenase SsuD/methylene tetrahydromethanopterin reductase-like flavin-dependent oxidoreductase (luciferase family)
MLRLTARYADAFNTVWYRDATAVTEPFGKLDAACQDVGRDPATVARTSGSYVALDGAEPTGAFSQTLIGQPEQMAARLRAFAAAGVEHMSIVLDPWTVAGIERFEAVIQALRA